jgi:hypothetical protein
MWKQNGNNSAGLLGFMTRFVFEKSWSIRRKPNGLVVSEHAVHGTVRLVLCSLLKAARSIVAWCKTFPGDRVRASGPVAPVDKL